MRKLQMKIIIVFTLYAFPISAGQNNKCDDSSTGEVKKLSELPKHEQLAHNNLSRKLDLLHIYTDYILVQNKYIFKLIKVLENEKNKDGQIDQGRFSKLLNEGDFPKIQDMKGALDKLSNDMLSIRQNIV